MNLTDLVLSRPFQTRNADEFPDENILELFVDPTNGVSGPFDYANEIIKGKMGTGKTMYLRANYNYHLSVLVPQMMDREPLVLPLYIRLSDFQNEHDPEKIYDKVIIKLIKEILTTSDRLQSAAELVKLHTGIKNDLFGIWHKQEGQKAIIEKINKLTAEEYTERIGVELQTKGTVGYKFVEACATYGETAFLELKKKERPQISDVVFAYETILRPIDCRLLILFDEVGSIDKCFFEENGNASHFETLLNQLRTLDFVRTKIAVYPHTHADVLTETRYGDVVTLEDNIYSPNGYDDFLAKTISVAEKYISAGASCQLPIEYAFDVSQSNMQLLEQIIYASDGNMRRLVQVLDATLNECYKRCQATERANIEDAVAAIVGQAEKMERLYDGEDLEYLKNIVAVCRKRTAYRFKFPNRSLTLSKYINKSAEYNILKVREQGAGRRGTTYWFDYAYCIYADIPTHYQFNSERIARSRSKSEGDWITTVTTITDELITQARIPGKIDGTISFLGAEKGAGFIAGEDGKTFFFTLNLIIKDDRNKPLTTGRKVRFIPAPFDDETMMACEIELL